MKTISVLGLFILLATGAASQHPVTHAENPHEAAHQHAVQAHEQAHNQAIETHRKAHEQALENHDQTKKRARKELLSRSTADDKSGFLARWKARRMERAAARESRRQKQQ